MEKNPLIFTNGCFDLLHPGHIDLLRRIKWLFPSSYLVVDINSDKSVKRLKGENRPIYNELHRKDMLLALKYVDEVLIFDESTPFEIISKIKPDIIIKGDDYYKENIVGFDNADDGVFIMKKHLKISTSDLIEKISNLSS